MFSSPLIELDSGLSAQRVAIIERSNVLGGAQVNTGTIPSKTLREAVIQLTGTGTTCLSWTT